MSNILAICIVLYNLCTVNNDVIKHEWITEKKEKEKHMEENYWYGGIERMNQNV